MGLATILSLIALILAWRRSRWTPLPIALVLVVIFLASNAWLSNTLVRSLEWQNLPQNLPNAEAIVLLGGSTKSSSFPRPMAEINEQGDRVLYAAKLYKEGKAPIIIAAGGRISWLSKEPPESSDMAELLKLMGVPLDAIIEESDSLNTYENAINVKKILTARNIRKTLLVTSALHMPRSLLIFKKQGIDTVPAPTDFLVSQSDTESVARTPAAILLNCLPDAYRLEQTTKALKEYIGIFFYALRGWL